MGTVNSFVVGREQQILAHIDHGFWKFLFYTCSQMCTFFPTLYHGYFFLSVAAKVNTTVKVHVIIPKLIIKKNLFPFTAFSNRLQSLKGKFKKHRYLFMAFCQRDIESSASFSLNTLLYCLSLSIYSWSSAAKPSCNFNSHRIPGLLFFSTSLLSIYLKPLNAKMWTRGQILSLYLDSWT